MAAKKQRKDRKRSTHATKAVTHDTAKLKLPFLVGAAVTIILVCIFLAYRQSFTPFTPQQHYTTTTETTQLYRKGMQFIYQNQVQKSLQYFDDCIALDAQRVDCYNSKAGALRMLGRTRDALQTLHAGEAAVSLEKDLAILYSSLFLLLKDLNQVEEAITYVKRSIAVQPSATKYYNWAAIVTSHQTKVELLTKALELDPNYFPAFCSRVNSYYFLGEWELVEQDQQKVEHYQQDLNIAGKDQRNTNSSYCLLPYYTTYMNISAAVARDTAIQFAQREAAMSKEGILPKLSPKDVSPLLDNEGKFVRKLKLGYVSSDYNIHPVGRNMLGVFMAHDTNKFDVYAFATKHRPHDEIAKIIQNHVNYVDVSQVHDYAAISRMIRNDYKIDVLVDLNGWTTGHVLKMFAARPAPVQLTHGLGFVATVGASSFDYYISDSIASPKRFQDYYTEKLVRLPQAYLPASHATVRITPQGNQYNPASANKTQLRIDNGLPEEDETFIYCSFQGFHRINRESFETWLRILAKVPNSIVWMTTPQEQQQERLIQRALDLGIQNPRQRILFSDTVNPGMHMVRAQACDLHLDSWPYTSHSTGVDVLWAGVPLLAYLSDYHDETNEQQVPKMASRVSASLLHTLGMSQLITPSIEMYEAEAVRYATDLRAYTKLRNDLLSKRLTSPLFDLTSFTRVHEAAYLELFEKFMQGRTPESIDVAPYQQPVVEEELATATEKEEHKEL